MDKKIAFIKLLENSLWISDQIKKSLLLKIDSLSDEQITELGKLLAYEREFIVKDKEKIKKNTSLFLQTLDDILFKK